MNGFTCLRGSPTLMLGLALLCVPTMLQAQTAEERAREQELRQRIEHRLQAVQEERLLRIEEALARAREQMVKAERGHREVDAARLQQLEQALATAGYMEHAEEARARAQEQVRKAQQVVVRVRSRVRLGVSLDGAQGAEDDRQGARIQSIIEGTPAEEAGLQEGDIITHLNGQSLLDPIPNEDDQGLNEGESLPVQRLMALAQDLDAGDEVEIRYLRDGSAETVAFEAAEIDDPSFTVLRGDMGDFEGLEKLKLELRDLEMGEPNIRFRTLPEGPVRGYAFGGDDALFVYSVLGGMAGFGLELAELNPGLAEYFSSDEGLLVLDVDEDSTLGLLPGDVILAIDGRGIEDQGDVRRILGSYEAEDTVSFTLVRKGQEITVEGTIR